MKQDIEANLAALEAERVALMEELSQVEHEQMNLGRQLEAAKAAMVGSMIEDLSAATVTRLRQRWPMFTLPVERRWFIGPLRFKAGVTFEGLQIQFRHFLDQRLKRELDESLAPLRLREEKLAQYAERVQQFRSDAEKLGQRIDSLQKLLAGDLTMEDSS